MQISQIISVVALMVSVAVAVRRTVRLTSTQKKNKTMTPLSFVQILKPLIYI